MSQECCEKTPVITVEDVAEARRKKKEYNDRYRQTEKGKQTTKLCVERVKKRQKLAMCTPARIVVTSTIRRSSTSRLMS